MLDLIKVRGDCWDDDVSALRSSEMNAVQATPLSLDQILKIADKDYNNGEALLTEVITPGERGDTLADFIVLLFSDACEGEAIPVL